MFSASEVKLVLDHGQISFTVFHLCVIFCRWVRTESLLLEQVKPQQYVNEGGMSSAGLF